MSLPLAKAKQLNEERRRGATTLLKLKENSTRPIGAIVVLNNIANIAGSVAVDKLRPMRLAPIGLAYFLP